MTIDDSDGDYEGDDIYAMSDEQPYEQPGQQQDEQSGDRTILIQSHSNPDCFWTTPKTQQGGCDIQNERRGFYGSRTKMCLLC
jgi:hypothetical protein